MEYVLESFRGKFILLGRGGQFRRILLEREMQGLRTKVALMLRSLNNPKQSGIDDSKQRGGSRIEAGMPEICLYRTPFILL